MKKSLFYLNSNIIFKDLQEEFLKMKWNSTAKNNFEPMPLTNFWEKYVHIYKSVDAVAICTLLSIYIYIYIRPPQFPYFFFLYCDFPAWFFMLISKMCIKNFLVERFGSYLPLLSNNFLQK